MSNLFKNWLLNLAVLATIVALNWATIQGASGVTVFTTPSLLILLLAISAISLVGELHGIIVAFFASLTFILIFFFTFIVGWVEIGFLEMLNLGFEYKEAGWVQNALV